MNEVDFYLEDLKSKFAKIDFDKYYLSYSGGRDSHFLYWFIKNYLKDNKIKIVGINTRMEHKEILRRIIDNTDIILTPKMKPLEIKKLHGTPCFTKHQDQMIHRYQRGSRTDSLMSRINGTQAQYSINKTARQLLLSGELHKVSDLCCSELKKKPAKLYEKETGRSAILGVRSSESIIRKSTYKGCFHKNKKFTPIHDLTDELLSKIEYQFNIEIPKIYNKVDRTGCVGCPYGKRKVIEEGLALISKPRLEYLLKYFEESWKIKGVNYETIKDTYIKSKTVVY